MPWRRSTDPIVRWLASIVAILLLLAGSVPAAGGVRSADGGSRSASEAIGSSFGIRPEEGEVERLYRAVLGRDSDRGGFEFWVVRRLEGWPLERVAAYFVDSPEYRQRFGAPSDQGFVDLLYRNVLGRSPDRGGRAFWLDQLESGMDRRRVVVLFSESPEFVSLTGTVPPWYADGRPPFAVESSVVTEDDLGASWRPGCPVGPGELVHLDLPHVRPDGMVATGRLTVHRDAAEDVAVVFAELYRRRVPITSIRPAADFDGDDDAMMAVDNTSGFNCRAVVGGSRWSRHAYGRAVDINPLVNPYVRGVTVLPPAAAPWVDRDRYHPGMLYGGGSVVATVRALGWRWGGDWRSLKDYQHIDTAS